MSHRIGLMPPHDDAELASIERATLDAVPPRQRLEIGPWLVAIDDGTIGRAHSAAALRADINGIEGVQAVERAYRDAARTPMFRLPDIAGLTALRETLRARGYRCSSPTLVQTAASADVAQAAHAALSAMPLQVDLAAGADDAWCRVFLGDGFDPVDGSSRVAILQRARHSVYASVRCDGRTVASGLCSVSHGWASVHGMRTLAPWRGRRMATAILQAMARHALAQGQARMFLQVELGNDGAQALYRRLGFVDRWCYDYWTAPG